jgi:hypothetical protein
VVRTLLVALVTTLVALFWTTRARAEVVRVHVDSPIPVQLEGQMASGWETMCTSPCDIMLPAGLTVRVTGEDMRPSEPTMLSPGSRSTLTVEPSLNPSRGASITVLVLGCVAAAPIVAVSTIAVFVVAWEVLACTHPLPGVGSYGACFANFLGNLGAVYAMPVLWVPAIPGVGAVALGAVSMQKGSGTPTGLRQNTVAAAPRWDVASAPAALPPVMSMPVWAGTF